MQLAKVVSILGSRGALALVLALGARGADAATVITERQATAWRPLLPP